MPIYDALGLPKDNGATDYQDSSRLAGMMAVGAYKYIPDLNLYVNSDLTYTRHPTEGNRLKFSRDQAVVLFAGLYLTGEPDLVNPNYQPENGDVISPSVRGHFKRCAGLKSNFIEDLWLWFDVLYSAYIDPLAEPNQLIAMLRVADHKYLRAWKKLNKSWERSIRKYWHEEDGYWRQEKELADAIINKLRSIT